MISCVTMIGPFEPLPLNKNDLCAVEHPLELIFLDWDSPCLGERAGDDDVIGPFRV